MRQTAEQVEQKKTETLVALSQFKEGDRVVNPKGELGTFMGVNNGYAKPECWIDFDSDLELDLPLSSIGFISCDPLLLTKIESCSIVSTSLVELEPHPVHQEILEELKPSSTSNGIASVKPCCEKTSLMSQSTETLPPLTPPPITESICSSHRPLAPHLAPQDDEMAALTIETCSPNVYESLTNANPDSSLSKMFPACCDVPIVLGGQREVISNGSQENYSIEATQETSAFLAVPNLDCHTSADDCLLLPTPTGLSSMSSRPPGQMKLESHLKKLGLLVRGQVVNPQFLEMMMKVDLDYTSLSKPGKQVSSLSVSRQKTPLKESDAKPSEIVSVFPAPKKSLNESCPSTALPELSIDEEKDRHDLERKVERAFYEAGSALREIRDRRLYRSTHGDNFVGYCCDRFGKTKQSVNYLIAACSVFENLIATTTIGCRVLPTTERQVRDLVSLEPDEQRQIWTEAVEKSNGKVPSGATVKGIVEQIKERTAQIPPPDYKVGEVVEIRSGGTKELRKHDGMWGIVSHVGSIRCTVHISLRNVTIQCKSTEMEKVNLMYTADIQAVSDRIKELSKLDLDPTVWAILETLARQTCFNEMQFELLEWVEKRYALSKKIIQ